MKKDDINGLIIMVRQKGVIYVPADQRRVKLLKYCIHQIRPEIKINRINLSEAFRISSGAFLRA